ncbi:ABC transporter ATP-binding protein [Frisingicoccus caecimuris]|uniref:ABC-2 type transport system ATP-binding protein n=1 Tax=Frisingicoccus caecimuris TaxID=1796636 RepID=A0A4V2SDL2_9FIRM|nr:ABC transporter ATP-binding protein [Frisingicoccus caecimuris]MCR1919412.1 ABC transporter ATP-binding protein [Frisingicoccus caecimuris]TCO83988.1 ABC-2 type transport system ATP-binding protein [Frisingicoccus caecimuris]
MKPGNAIEVKNVKKKFKVYFDKGSQLKERILFRNRNRYEERWVLDDVSFEVKQGEAIGLIGHNGCGKSTTLKLLTRIMYPDSGSIELKGRVSSLIELGAGFHPDMSGRENIYTNASIFGLTKKEIDERLDDIIEFSEMEPFLDNPVRTYSSGMYMRLAFSVAINVNADILLIDEILAVGDVNFQAKCFNKLREIKAQGTTIVIVSHSMGQIEQICDRSIWIHEGKIKAEGNPREIDKDYLDFMGQKRQEIAEQSQKKDEAKTMVAEEIETRAEAEEKKRWGNGRARFREVCMSGKQSDRQRVFATEESVKIRMNYKVKQKVQDAVFGIGIFRDDGVQCYGTNTRIEQFKRFDLDKDGEVVVNIEKLSLLPGKYTLDVAIESDMATPVDYFRQAYSFEVYSSLTDVGVFRMEHQWEV